MTETLTYDESREASMIAGEMAASRLHDLIQERLQELALLGFTQADIARAIGATQQQVGHWLVEPRNITVRSAGRLLSGLQAHLLFDLDRYEDIEAGNCPAPTPAPQAPRVTVIHPHATELQAPTPTSIRILAGV